MFPCSSPVRGSLFIDCSTTDPQTSIDVGQVAEDKGCVFVDAPVSGGTLLMSMLHFHVPQQPMQQFSCKIKLSQLYAYAA